MGIRNPTVFENESIGGRWSETGSLTWINLESSEFKRLGVESGSYSGWWQCTPTEFTVCHSPATGLHYIRLTLCTLPLHETVSQRFFPTLHRMCIQPCDAVCLFIPLKSSQAGQVLTESTSSCPTSPCRSQDTWVHQK